MKENTWEFGALPSHFCRSMLSKYPFLQSHVNEPGVLIQTCLHPPFDPRAHSSKSEKKE